jgi:AcrR family transcriptional regulator
MDNKHRIIEGAADLFRIYGIKSVTMDSLASHLGMSKRTIYEVFSNKEDLLTGVLKWMTEKQKELIERILNGSDNALAAIFKLLEINRDHFQSLSPVFYADIRKYHYDVLINNSKDCELPDFRNNVQVIERGISEKLFREDINADLANRCLYFLGRSVMDQELYPFEQFTRREVVKNVFINYLRGISTNEGVDLINKLEAEF